VSNKSFTLIEILTVILIVGILSGVIIVATNNVIDSTQDAKRKKDLDSISKALMEYGVMTGSYPVEASECNIGDGTCLDELIDSGYAKGFPLDPSGDRYKYTSDGTTYTIKATLSDNQTLAYNPDSGYSQMQGLAGYSKRKPITLTNSGSSLTDYQISITLYYDSDMKSSFDDIRFTSSDGVTELNYWTESVSAGISAVFWVKVPSIPNGNSTIYAYYGNASASSASNGDNTFGFFKDIENVNIGSIGDWVLEKTGNFNTAQTVYAYQDNTKTVRVYAEQNGSWAGWYYTWARWNLSLSSDDYVLDGQYKSNYTNSSYWRTSIQVNGVEKNGGAAPNTNWNNFSYNLLSQEITYLRFGNYDYQHTAGHGIFYDNLRIRKYVSSVPNVNVGPEE